MEQTVYIGTYTDAISRGIYRFAFYKGDLRLLGCIEETNPSYVIVQGDMLYSVRETRDGSIVSYQLQKDGIHTLVGQQKCLGDAPCHLHLDGAYLYASNYSSGSLAQFSLDEQLRVKEPPTLFSHVGHSVHPSRQAGPHVHFSATTPDGQFLAVCDLGLDQVVFYRRTPDGVVSDNAERVHLQPGFGPRHAVFGDNGIWYLICELSCKLIVFQGFGVRAKPVQEFTLDQFPDSFSSGAAVKMSPDRKCLLASVRGTNSLTLFSIGSDGRLEPRTITGSRGDWPRDAAFSPCSKYVLCACERSDSLSIFKLTNCDLVFIKSFSVPSPACICFATV